jgi:hypothetical protein
MVSFQLVPIDPLQILIQRQRFTFKMLGRVVFVNTTTTIQ